MGDYVIPKKDFNKNIKYFDITEDDKKNDKVSDIKYCSTHNKTIAQLVDITNNTYLCSIC